MNKEEKSIENQAKFDINNLISYNNCDHCIDPLLFGMKDNYHEFSLGLFTVLDCLKLAEKNGYVPPLPEDWWISICRLYDLNLSP